MNKTRRFSTFAEVWALLQPLPEDPDIYNLTKRVWEMQEDLLNSLQNDCEVYKVALGLSNSTNRVLSDETIPENKHYTAAKENLQTLMAQLSQLSSELQAVRAQDHKLRILEQRMGYLKVNLGLDVTKIRDWGLLLTTLEEVRKKKNG